MATFTIPRLIQLRPIVTVAPTVKPVAIAPVVKALPVYVPAPLPQPVIKVAPYLPSIAPRQPVVVPLLPAPASPEPVRAPEPAPLTAHRFSTCVDCGKEKVTDIETPVAPTLTLAPPAPVATPAPTPTPATPTAEVKPKGGRSWLVAFAVLFLLVGGLALASAVRPRK